MSLCPANRTAGQRLRWPVQAGRAVPAGQRRVDRDGHAVPRAADHDAGHLVAEHHRPVELRVADAALGVPVQVRAAQPDGADPDQVLARARDRVGLLVQDDRAGGVQPGRPHTSCRRVRSRASA